MCYSAESSIISFLIGGSLSLYLILCGKNNTNKHIGLFLFSVCLIQLLEYLMWIDQDCSWKNDIASRSIMLVLSLQLYSIFLGAYIYKTTILSDNILKIILITLTPVFIYFGFKDYFKKNKKWCSKPNEDRSLQWVNQGNSKMLSYVYYAVFLISPFMLKELYKGLIIFIFGLLTFIFTRYENTLTSNSRWCYFSSFIPIVFILLDIYGK